MASRTATIAGRAAPPERRVRPASRVGPARATAGGLLVVFLVSLFIPISVDLAGLRLSPARLFLLVAFVPLFLRWISGSAGRVTAGDVLIGLHCLWIGLALAVAHGAERIPYAGITVVELFGGYLVGRTLIRSAADYRALFRYLMVALVFLLPFVVVEVITSRLIINDIFGSVFATFERLEVANRQRFGLYRAQAVFEHPILFGLLCSICIANTFHIFGFPQRSGVLLTGVSSLMTFLSLSSAPLLSAFIQFGLIVWGYLTRNAWWVLGLLVVTGYVAVDLLSNRTPVTIFISMFTFDPGSSWYRIHAFDHGIQEVLRNPLFGIGLDDWQRAWWMYSGSIDNFWLVVAMRYGIPGFLLLVAGILANLVQILRQHELPETVARYRRGYAIASVGLFVTLCTVHMWGPTSVFVMFYLGAGSWIFIGSHAGVDQAVPRAPASARDRRQRGDAAVRINPWAEAREAIRRRREARQRGRRP